MLKIKVTTNFQQFPLLRQTPQRAGRWGNYQFIVDDPNCTECDFWVVFDGLAKPEKVLCTRGNTIFVTAEPSALYTYKPAFLKQFSYVVTCHKKIHHRHKIIQQQALPWHIGGDFQKNIVYQDYDSLKNMPPLKKTKLISLITSNKTLSEGHLQRLQFTEALKAHFGSQLDIYGRGLKEIPDKWEAIATYKYHIALENSQENDYWTEKLADPFLGNAYPFYFGCKNITSYFPADALSSIDIFDIKKSIEIITQAIDNKHFERSFQERASSKELVLDKYNFFNMIAELCDQQIPISKNTSIRLRPESSFEDHASLRSIWAQKNRSNFKQSIVSSLKLFIPRPLYRSLHTIYRKLRN